ncbi:hypothetical protein PHLCEN_2v13214 [Hermanssonia centrifuga]|uniref:Uncharacterized protein n=1 Tax=Hermanssonia centrifuga TaxID=98765 RepID=A0A2R6NEU4_9APHY|nr:hypothetical protein PHLCEN_2v13214 [Hermanssonia centrifuga]
MNGESRFITEILPTLKLSLHTAALLVVFSPTDSLPTAWAGTLLTAALIVAAIAQKANGNLTLHHATLVMK